MTKKKLNAMPAELRIWKVIEIFDTEVPKKVLTAIKRDQANIEDGYVYTLMWKDCLVGHFEDGWSINDDCIINCEKWLDKQAKKLGLGEREVFWLRIKTS